MLAQIVEFLPQRVFNRIVDEYDGNKCVKHFTRCTQQLCMVLGQLTIRDSLRDMMVALDAHSSKFNHLGFGMSVIRSNFARPTKSGTAKSLKSLRII
jgi:hypothetical protein